MQIGHTPNIAVPIPPDARQVVSPGGGQTTPTAYAATAATAAPVQRLSSYGTVATGKTDHGATAGQNGGRNRTATTERSTVSSNLRANTAAASRSRGQFLDLSV